MTLKKLFFPKITKNCAVAGGSAPRSLFVIVLVTYYFTQQVSQFRRFRFLTFRLSPLLLPKSCLSVKLGHGF